MRNKFNPATFEGFMPNEKHLCDNNLRKEAINSIMTRMNIPRDIATLKYEIWENEY